jgi:sugar phosphate isomerase/epimerase
MQVIMFTKLFRELGSSETAALLSEMGFDGVDLLIREGWHVTPQTADSIQGVVTQFKQRGLNVPMATCDAVDPSNPITERIIAHCAEAGIGVLRIGYWRYDLAHGYRTILKEAQDQLAGLARLAERHSICLALQLHGGTIHSSSGQALHLLTPHDPRYVGAYVDPGNQVVQEGREDWRLTLDALEPWLCCLGVKNGGWFAGMNDQDGQRRWQSDWLPLSDGMFPWSDILAHLSQTRFSGILSLHSQYRLPFAQAVAQTGVDLGFVRRILGDARQPT